MMARPASFPPYQPQAIEPKWQQHWEAEGTYLASAADETGQPKFYCLDFFPYPSGEGLHVGHCRNYVPTDVMARFMRMNGYNVLHPMGWDAFGEPAEQYAVRQGIHPRQATDRNTANYRRQMTLIGKGIDWSREIDSSQPEYYRWTQFFFLELYKRGLAYRDTQWQWWCPTCQTTLSNNEAAGGVCWRGHTGLVRREIPAWYFRITAYADELLSGLETVDWPEKIKAMQRNWIGRSEGARIEFLTEGEKRIAVFTTRADTLFGVTFLALAPEHPLVGELVTGERRAEVESYCEAAKRKSEIERMTESREKSGVFSGSYARNPLSGEAVPVWVADYVLPGYGGGAVMGVPAHDSRDFEFAARFGLTIRRVIWDEGRIVAAGERLGDEASGEAFTGEGRLIHSGAYDGMESAQARQKITLELEKRGLGGESRQYRMRDWLISRQRYWGTPIPIVHCERCGEQPVPEQELPVRLPPLTDFQPDGSGRAPLARVESFVNTICPACGGPAQRETDTMGGFACSSWYFLRFASPHEDKAAFTPEAVSYWLPVDLYVGGAEHAVLHLLYARFWTKALADAGMLTFREPFQKLANQGQMLGADGQRMSKSRGNVITPDETAATYGADALRLYVMFMAPFEQDVQWSTEGLNGMRRFLNRVWKLYAETYHTTSGDKGSDPTLERLTHRTIHRVSQRIQGFRLNTMVSTLMEFANALEERQRRKAHRSADYHRALDALLVLLAPAAPHFTEELWQLCGKKGSVHRQVWPSWRADLAAEDTVQIAVQVDGKVRQVIEAPVDASEEEVQALALADERVQQHLAGRPIERTIFAAGRAFSLVTRRN